MYVDTNEVRTRARILKILIGILKKFIILVRYFSGISCDRKVESKGINIPDRPYLC